jgi:hypothetical protein
VLDYKIQRCLLNPHRIKHYHEAEAISEYLGIAKNWQGTGHEDFSTLMLELHGEKDPDSYFQTHDGRKIFAECLEKTEGYIQWSNVWESKQAYERLSIIGKLAYYLIIACNKLIKYPSLILRYCYAGVSNWADYRFRQEQYKEYVKRELSIRLENESVLGQRISNMEDKVFKKKKSAKKKKINKKKFKRVSKATELGLDAPTRN